MSSDHLRLEIDTALADSGKEVLDESDVMRGQIQALIGHIEGIPEAIQGGAEHKFSEAGKRLSACFNDLLDWCQDNGVNLNEANNILQQTTGDSIDAYGNAGSQIDGLSRGVNG